ncbi:MAG: hypothetical protein FWG74_09465, partial [Planctomycetes bacterium]|nr:hypothetical protein [Planctomycetota bacterium]
MSELFWKKKLMALLHDPPDKCWDIGGHEEQARLNQIAAGFRDDREREDFKREMACADRFASSCERFVFPQRKCSHDFAKEPR